MAPSANRYNISECIILIRRFDIQTMNDNSREMNQWTHSTIITMYNNCFKPMDNGSMITSPMVNMDIC
jgi:hypothetical protein